jgi:hypothetical protein
VTFVQRFAAELRSACASQRAPRRASAGGAWLPVAILRSPLLGFLVPLLCSYLDRVDARREDTLGDLARLPGEGAEGQV